MPVTLRCVGSVLLSDLQQPLGGPKTRRVAFTRAKEFETFGAAMDADEADSDHCVHTRPEPVITDRQIIPHPAAFAALRELARDTKERLSNETQTAVYLPFEEGSAKPRTCEITRAQLDSWATPILERTRTHCLRALADAKLAASDLDAVILVGGATRMPLVRALVAEIFGREPDTTQNPDEAVALGATIQAGILAGSVRDVILLDVTPLSLGIETFGGLANVIIPRNTTIPIKAGEMFTNAVAGQRTVEIHVVQGERERARVHPDVWR